MPAPSTPPRLFLACLLLLMIHSRCYCQAHVQEQQQQEIRPMSPAAARAHVIHSLETKLETDLKRVEKDAAKAAAKDHRHGNHTIDLSPRNLTSRLDKDLVRVRTDVRHLVRAIEAAEMELQVLKQQMLVQQLELQQKKTKMTTEKILDQLHAGKLSVKVDYVTGELVRTNNVHASLRGANRQYHLRKKSALPKKWLWKISLLPLKRVQ